MTEGMKWTASVDDQNYDFEFDSKDAAIAHAPARLNLAPGANFYIAPLINHVPHLTYEDVAIALLQQADEALGDEVPEHFLEGVPVEAQKELADELNKVLSSWLGKHHYKLDELIGKPVPVVAPTA